MSNVVCSQAIWRSTLPIATLLDHLETTFPKESTGVFVLNGNRMAHHAGLFETFQKELKFPDYFGHNTNAFLECITDMDWLVRDSYWVVIEHPENLLKDLPEDLGWFLDICQKVSSEWSQPIALGESWDRPAKPFVFIFLFSEEKKAPEGPFASLPLLDEKLLTQK